MTLIEKTFLLLLRNAFSGFLTTKNFPSLSKQEWHNLMDLAFKNGLNCEVLDAINLLPKEKKPPFELLIKWIGLAVISQKVYNYRKEVATEYASVLARERIQCFVLKGLGISRYYNKPENRGFGDFDCFLVKDGSPAFEKGMEIACEMGAVINNDCSYKHQQIFYKKLMIENHQFISNFDNTKKGIYIEKLLRQLIVSNTYQNVEGSDILVPPPHFQALHILKHSLDDFLNDGLLLRQVYDWAVFLRAEQRNLDWKRLTEDLNNCHLRKFCDALTIISLSYFGLQLSEGTMQVSSNTILADEILQDTLTRNLSFGKDKTIFHKIRRIYHRIFFRMWHFRSIATESYPFLLWKTFAFSSYMHRTVTLE